MPDGSSPTPRSLPATDRSSWWIAAITVAVLAPFLGKAFHIDDPLFIYAAEQILREPFDPYGFDVNWYGFPMPMHRVTQNPPLTSYFIALVASFAGFREWALHGAFVLPAVAAVLGTYRLARAMGARPVVAALIVALAPGFVVSSTNVMSDTILLALWTWSVLLWRRGLVENQRRALVAAAVLAGLACLTKYFGVCLVLLLLVDTVLRRRRFSREAAWLLIPVAMLAGCMVWSNAVYGHMPIIGAAQYATQSQTRPLAELPLLVLVSCSFVGGCLLPALLLSPMWLSPRQLVGAVLIATAAALACLPMTQNVNLLVHTALFAGVGAAMVVVAIAGMRRPVDPDRWLLALWIVGTLAFVAFINWTINARSILPMAPAAAILVARRLKGEFVGVTSRRLAYLFVVAGAASLIVAFADQSLARSSRVFARDLAAREWFVPQRIAFQGAWGFNYYMRRHGFDQIDITRTTDADVLVAIHMQNTNCIPPEPRVVRSVDRVQLKVYPYAATHDHRVGAGFYSHNTYGPVPFVFGPAPPAEVRMYRLAVPVRWMSPQIADQLSKQFQAPGSR